MGLIQKYVPEEKIKRTLTTRHKVTGTALGAFFGALTPFCSCSTIPVLVGLINSKVPFGACMAFLFASPLLNPIIVFLVLAFFGPVPMLIYCLVTFCIAVLSGLVLERRGYLRYVKTITEAGNVSSHTAAPDCCSCGINGDCLLLRDWEPHNAGGRLRLLLQSLVYTCGPILLFSHHEG